MSPSRINLAHRAAPLVRSLLVVGGGAAAFAAATRAADDGVAVTMVNDGLPLGGTCVNVGCMPSKMTLDAVGSYAAAARGRGDWLRAEGVRFDYAALRRARDAMVASARGRNYRDVLEALGNVTLVEGRARFVGPREVEVVGKRHRGDAVLVATGGRTDLAAVPGLAAAGPLTNANLGDLEGVPASVAVVGAGPLGLEWAQALARAGLAGGVRVEVFGRVLPRHEPEVADALAARLAEDDGIRLHADRRVVRVEGKPGALRVVDDCGGAVEVERVLAANGLRPNVDGLGLEAAGVATDARGFVRVDARGETSSPGVYAAGDVTGLRALEPVAAKQGFLAAHNAITGESRTIAWDAVPEAVFTDPQVAKVGWTEARAMAEIGACDCRTVPLSRVPRAHAVGEARGLVKLVAHPRTRRILGAHAVGPSAAEIIHVPTMAIRAGWTLDDLLDTVHVFPTYAEAWKLAAATFDRDPDTLSCCTL